MKLGRVVVATVSGLVILAGAIPARADAGDLDPSFGRGGITTVDLGSTVDGARGMAIQPDGKTLVAANGHFGGFAVFAVIRLMPDGTLDPSFGSGGIAQMHVGRFADNTTALALQMDGRIVVAGKAFDEDQYGSRWALARFNPDGTPDLTFGRGGQVLKGFGGIGSALDLAIQPDGRIVVVGIVSEHGCCHPGLARYMPDGSLDQTFGRGGKVVAEPPGDYFSYASAVALLPDGRIVMAGTRTNVGSRVRLLLVRYQSNGRLDASFGRGGYATIRSEAARSDDTYGSDIQLDQLGRAVVVGLAGFGRYSLLVARFTDRGELDRSFGVNGMELLRFSDSDVGSALVLQPDGKILVGGGVRFQQGWLLVRLSPNGPLDTSFGDGGAVITELGPGRNSAADLALQPDGRIIVAGNKDSQGIGDVAVARYLSD